MVFRNTDHLQYFGYLEFSVGLVQMSTQVATQQNGIDCGDSIMVG